MWNLNGPTWSPKLFNGPYIGPFWDLNFFGPYIGSTWGPTQDPPGTLLVHESHLEPYMGSTWDPTRGLLWDPTWGLSGTYGPHGPQAPGTEGRTQGSAPGTGGPSLGIKHGPFVDPRCFANNQAYLKGSRSRHRSSNTPKPRI